MSDDVTFIGRCLKREAAPDEIDDFVDRWHDRPSARPLYAALGMTQAEYALWVRDPATLPAIIQAHREAPAFHEPGPAEG